MSRRVWMIYINGELSEVHATEPDAETLADVKTVYRAQEIVLQPRYLPLVSLAVGGYVKTLPHTVVQAGS